MNRRNRDRLLGEIFTADETLGDFRRVSLETALAALARRRRRRRLLGVCALVAPALLLALLTFHRAPAPVPVSAPAQPPKIESISDTELLALFPGRSLALIGPPGRQQLVFLDEFPKDSPSP